MSTELVMNYQKIEQALIAGDLSQMTPEQRVGYYKAVCESLGLNPLTKPFDYLTLSGKLVLYAKRDATDQLRRNYGVSVRVTDRKTIDGVYVVTAQATDRSGRTDESTGAVTVANLKGDALANAFMKAETKAKRRVTLSICGLGVLDETEVESVADDAPRPAAPKALPPNTPSARARFAQRFAEAKTRAELEQVTADVARAKRAGELTEADCDQLRLLARQAAKQFAVPTPAGREPGEDAVDESEAVGAGEKIE